MPSEAEVSQPDGVARVLRDAGFEDLQIEQRVYAIRAKTDDYIASRLVSMSSRYMLLKLSTREWERFVAQAHETLNGQFGEMLSFESSVTFAVARKE